MPPAETLHPSGRPAGDPPAEALRAGTGGGAPIPPDAGLRLPELLPDVAGGRVHRLGPELRFPDPRSGPRSGRLAGLVAVGGDLGAGRILLAYRRGLFPWTDAPITWWSPDPRGILELDRLHVSASLARTLRSGGFVVTRNQAFRRVIEQCAAPAPGRRSTWITPGFVEAYTELHRQGHAHSVECWREGELAGGIYGVAVGGMFAGESMFHRVRDASKVALVHLVRHLQAVGFALFDLQVLTPVTRRFGAVAIPREEYLRRLARAVDLKVRF